MDIKTLIDIISTTPDCRVYSPAGLPTIRPGHVLPHDLRGFYQMCGGLSLFEKADYSIVIVPPEGLVLANPVIVGEVYEDDISASWYLIAHDKGGEYLTIDLDSKRLGRCYDSFSDRHAIVGSSPVIATSFTDLLTRLYENKGQHWYWLRPEFKPLSDAYDP